MSEEYSGRDRRRSTVDTTDLRVDVEVLKKDVDTLTNLCEKMDRVIEKLVEHQDVIINQIYQDMDKRKSDTNNDIKDLHSRISTVSREMTDKMESTEKKIMEEIKSLKTEMKNTNEKEMQDIHKLMEWKWQIVGGLIVISWLTSHIGIDTILKLVK